MNIAVSNEKRQPHSSAGQMLRRGIERVGMFVSPSDAIRILKLKVLEQAQRDALAISNQNVHRRLLHNRNYHIDSQTIINEHLALERWLKFEDLDGTSLNSRDLCQETGGDFKRFRAEILEILNGSETATA